MKEEIELNQTWIWLLKLNSGVFGLIECCLGEFYKSSRLLDFCPSSTFNSEDGAVQVTYSYSVWLARKRALVTIHFISNVSVMTSLSVWLILVSLTDYTYTDRKVCWLSGSPLATTIFAPSPFGIRCTCFDDSGPRRVFLSLALVCLGEIPGWSCQ